MMCHDSAAKHNAYRLETALKTKNLRILGFAGFTTFLWGEQDSNYIAEVLYILGFINCLYQSAPILHQIHFFAISILNRA
jgi:hypothetical protein